MQISFNLLLQWSVALATKVSLTSGRLQTNKKNICLKKTREKNMKTVKRKKKIMKLLPCHCWYFQCTMGQRDGQRVTLKMVLRYKNVFKVDINLLLVYKINTYDLSHVRSFMNFLNSLCLVVCWNTKIVWRILKAQTLDCWLLDKYSANSSIEVL